MKKVSTPFPFFDIWKAPAQPQPQPDEILNTGSVK
jgi:hypothetical protein